MPDHLIEIKNLKRQPSDRDRPLLDVGHLMIRPGDRIALAGPIGSGKSTLLRAVAMLDPCEVCRIRFGKTEVTHDSVLAYRRQVIYLPQRPAMVASTVRDNLKLPFQMTSRPTTTPSQYQEQQAIALFEELGKPGSFLDQPADELSGGERQLVSLVRALQLQPLVLLMDEPTASLDTESTRRLEQVVMRWYRDESDARRAFVLVTHDSDLIERMTDRIIHIRDGAVDEDGEHV